MASGRFSKQAVWRGPLLNSANAVDTQIAGAINTAPTGLYATQYTATLPGDRIILSPADAYAWSNNNVGNLYTGTYRYVSMRNNSTSSPIRARAAFWDNVGYGNNNTATVATDELYQVTSDEAANIGVALMAGVYVNNVAVNNNGNFYWWIQESGKATCAFGAAGIAYAIGQGVYLAALGANNNQGLFTSANSAGNTGAINDTQMVRFVGIAETLPVANNTSIVDLTLSRASFRW